MARVEETGDAYRALMGKPKIKRSLERPRLNGKKYIKTYFKGISRRSLKWVSVSGQRKET